MIGQRTSRALLAAWRATAAALLGGILLLPPRLFAPGNAPARADSASTRVEISLDLRRLWVLDHAGDTLLVADVAVGSGRTLTANGRTWTFRTPRGESVVVRKDANPIWIPPDWHYIEVARRHGLRVEQLSRDAFPLRDASRIVVRENVVGILSSGGVFRPFPRDEEIIRDGTLFIPPFGTVNRMIPGVLGEYRLLLANGVSLHGTPDQDSVGQAVSHGCIRLRDADIAWLFANVPLGARVLIR